VDDEASCIRTLSQLLEGKEYLKEYKTYTSAQQFVEELSENRSDVFFMDIEMPWKDGLALSKLLQGKKVIVVSGHKELNNEATTLKSYIDFVKKPISAERLELALQRLLEKSSITREYINLPTKDFNDRRFRLSEIVKIVTHDQLNTRWKAICFENRKPEIAKVESFQNLLIQLDPAEFIQINKGCIIQKKFIEGRVNATEVKHVPVAGLPLKTAEKSNQDPLQNIDPACESIGTTCKNFDEWFR
jgi:FixJ family two-component response regulator